MQAHLCATKLSRRENAKIAQAGVHADRSSSVGWQGETLEQHASNCGYHRPFEALVVRIELVVGS